ncbi:acetyltransferase (GNAT) family protein [Agromyces ramosus]|uniref:Acetyltransferase (GNAT) family protein n=1 Tax=Agromyces ramosus TaxID=33879 RepID=A0A4Q7MFW8_9MICO|nr:GNAT family N-acetyltransferase [Agromyces ramosus]RZS66008.1 acetyltransferase (GNAT) family protein [Agromyces ramosus]
MSIEIRPVPVPRELGTPEARDFEAYAALGFELERANWGHDHFAETAAELLGFHRNDAHRGRLLIGAFDGDAIIGRSGLGWERDEASATVEITLGVHPSHRRRGVGSRLLVAAEHAARELGRATVVAYSDHPDPAGGAHDGPVLRAPDGDAELSASAPAAAFAAAHGYSLAQLERVSSLAVSGRVDEFRRELEARAVRAADRGYRLELWNDRTPEALVDAYAAARERMVLEVPAGGVTIDPERWDAARVREHEAEQLDGGTSVLVAAAITDEGVLAGYTELELPRGRAFAYQYDTLVVRAHRGHGLGMLVKLANLVRLAELAPERAVVYTWNADENEHMLAINIALGFRRCGLEAIWQRERDEAPAQADAG